ncbi:helix-turn-helix domain-containing protein [Streptomyces sp. NPDC048304]|uniref:helix-turn-helix domain-containing protein n=1 Tax=Streptomyces sp. NPDC048304 TaxID=3154820 RepID=UPI0033CF07B7
MHGTPRPPATPAKALSAMDHLIAAHLIGQQELARRLGLNVTDLTCFAFVLEAGDDLLTAGDLAARAHVTTGAVTGILNRLERAGYVTRRPDPTDRRRVRVAAVPDAVTRVEAVYAGHYHPSGTYSKRQPGDDQGLRKDSPRRAEVSNG